MKLNELLKKFLCVLILVSMVFNLSGYILLINGNDFSRSHKLSPIIIPNHPSTPSDHYCVSVPGFTESDSIADAEEYSFPYLTDDTNGDLIDDSLELKMRTERNPIKVMVILNRSESYEDFEQFLMAHGISSFSRGEFPYDYYAIEAPAKIIKKIPSSFDYVIGVKENVKSELCMSESLATVGVFPSLHQNFDLKGDSDMSVAVIDWGFDPTHPSLASGLYYWKDFTANASPIATDPFGHGTAVSSLIMGRPFNTTDSQGRQVVCGDQSYHYSKADLIENVKYISTVGGYNISTEGEILFNASWQKNDAQSAVYISKFCIVHENGTYLAITPDNIEENTNYTLSYTLKPEDFGVIQFAYIFETSNNNTSLSYNIKADIHIPFNYGSEHTNFSGVAPNTKLIGLCAMYEDEILDAMNWIIDNSNNYTITTVCLSFSFGHSYGIADAVRRLVDAGITVVASAGNDISLKQNLAGSVYNIPASVAEVISVGATNNKNAITSYSANGGVSYSGITIKPDLIAPGGEYAGNDYSLHPILLPDSNDGDNLAYNPNHPEVLTLFDDRVPDNTRFYTGTSFSAPIVAGAALLLMQARGGMDNWGFTKEEVMEIKARLLMAAAETGQNRSTHSLLSPTLNRGAKDSQEGYGLLNVKAAVETYTNKIIANTTISETLTCPRMKQFNVSNVWAGNFNFKAEKYYELQLKTSDMADFDIYIYESSGNKYGDPILIDKITTSGLGINESMNFTVHYNKSAIITVKCLNGTGNFTFNLVEYSDFSSPYSVSILNDLSTKFYTQTLPMSATAVDLGTGIRKYQVFARIQNSGLPFQLIHELNSTNEFNVPIDSLADGYYEIYLQALDGAGNSNKSDSQIVAIDNTPPDAVYYIEPNDYYMRAYGNFYIIINATDAFSGIQTVYILDYQTRGIFSSATKETGPYVFLWPSTMEDDGDWYIIGSAKDKAGNFKDTAYGITVKIVNKIEQELALLRYSIFGIVSFVMLYYVAKRILFNVDLSQLSEYFTRLPSKVKRIIDKKTIRT